MAEEVADGDVAVVQRHANERTQQAGLTLAEREFPGAVVTTVAAGDFPTTLRRCFETAVALDRKWTVTVDGDVLLLPGAGRAIRRLATRMPRRAGHVDLLVQDRVTGEARSAGVRLYRTATMREALLRGDWSGTLRPESALLASLSGVDGWSPSVLVGLHDHEQFLRDLFRTAFVMIRKKAHQQDRLLALWATRADGDDDLALLAGGRAATREDLPFSIDATAYTELADELLSTAGLREREPILRVPTDAELERLVPDAARRLRRPSFAAQRMPRVWRKYGNGVHGLPLARYALERMTATALRR
jgi:hypothetical protein